MATPPTRAAFASPSTGNYTTTATTRTTTAFAVQAGDLIVVVASIESAGTSTNATPTASGGSVTWTLRASRTAGGANQSGAWLWTGVVGATAASITVTLARPNTDNTKWWGCSATVWRGHAGVGQVIQTDSGTTSSVAQATTPTLAANSAVQIAMSDWNAVAVASRSWQVVNGSAMTESLYVNGTGRATAYGSFRPDVGAAGTKVVGLTTPATLRWVMVGVEILGTGGGGTTQAAAGTVPATTTTTASAVARLVAAGTLAATTTAVASTVALLGAGGAVAGSSTATGSATVLSPAAGSVAATSTVTGSAARLGQSFPAAGTVAGTSDTTGSASVRLAAAGTVGATSTTSATAVARLGASGTAAATTTVAGTASVLGGPVAHPAAGVVAVVSTATGAVRLRAGAAGVIPAVFATSATVSLRATAAGTAPAVTTTTGAVGSLYRVGGTVAAVSDVTGSATVSTPDAPPTEFTGRILKATVAAPTALGVIVLPATTGDIITQRVSGRLSILRARGAIT